MNPLKGYKAIVYVSNIYSLLQYLLLTNDKVEETAFLFHPKFPAKRKDLYRKFSVPFFFKNVSFNHHKVLIQALLIRLYALLYPRTQVYLSGYFVFTDLLMNVLADVYALEDGLTNYYEVDSQDTSKKTNLRRRLFLGQCNPCKGVSDKVKKVFLSGARPIPVSIAHKTEIFNLKSLWEKQTPERKQLINDLLLPTQLDLSAVKSRSVILLTQPLSEDNLITESEKIEVYKTVVASYDQHQLVIKTHPREKTDYKLYFPQAYIISGTFPMELLSLNNPDSFKKAITINSTSIYAFGNEVEKIEVGTKPFPKLSDAFFRVFKIRECN